jgi:hypothetical protein
VFAWQHTVDIFRAVGATNVKFVWCSMAFDYANGVAPRYWPGAGYVDYVGADGYDFPGSHWFTFARIFTAAYNYSVAQARPLFIAETAATATDPQASAWITAAEAWAENHPNVAAVVYFDSISPKAPSAVGRLIEDLISWVDEPGQPVESVAMPVCAAWGMENPEAALFCMGCATTSLRCSRRRRGGRRLGLARRDGR